MSDDRIKYLIVLCSKWGAPEWAKKPSERSRGITSFGKPLSKAEYDPRLVVLDDMLKHHAQQQDDDSDKPFKPTVEQIEEILLQETDDDVQVYCIMDGY